MSLSTFLFYTLIRLKSIIVFLVSLYGFLNLTLDQLCLEKTPSDFKTSQSIDLLDQLVLHFDGEPYLSPHIYDLTHKEGERYNESGFPINCEIKHSLPSVGGKNRSVEYGDSFNNVILKRRGKEIFQYNYTVEISNKIIIKNFTRNLKIFYSLDNNGMFKSSLMSISPESCSMEARVIYSQLTCKKPENLNEVYFLFLVSFVSLYIFLCIWTRFSKGLSRRIMFKLHEMFSETKGFEFCNEYTKSWVDFKGESCYVEKDFDELDGDGMKTAFIGGKFYTLSSNEAFISDGSKTERIELNINDSQYVNLLKYVRALNISFKNCFVEGTHFLTLKEVLKKYNDNPNFYVGIKKDLTDRIMDPKIKIGLVDSLNFNLLMKSCPDCCPKKAYKLYYHFLSFQANCKRVTDEFSVFSRNCSFLKPILNRESFSISPFQKPSCFKSSSWKYYLSDLWKLLKSVDIEMKEPSEKRKDSEALKETLNLSEDFLEKEVKTIVDSRKLKISELIDYVSIENTDDPCCLVYKGLLNPPTRGDENKPKNVYKERVKGIFEEISESYDHEISEVKSSFNQGLNRLTSIKLELGLEDENWEDVVDQVKLYKDEYNKAKSKRLKEKIDYENEPISEVSKSIDEFMGKICEMSISKGDNLVLNVKDRKVYIDEFTSKGKGRCKPKADKGSFPIEKRSKIEDGEESQMIELPFKNLQIKDLSTLRENPFPPTFIFLEILGLVMKTKFKLSCESLAEGFIIGDSPFFSIFLNSRIFKSFEELLNRCNFYEINYISKAMGLENYINNDGELNYDFVTQKNEDLVSGSKEVSESTLPEFGREHVKKYLGSICNKGVIELIREESEFYKRRKERKRKKGGKMKRGRGGNKGKQKIYRVEGYEKIKLDENNRFKKSSEIPCLILALNLACSKGGFSKNKVFLKEAGNRSITPCCNHLVKRYVYFLNKILKDNKIKGEWSGWSENKPFKEGIAGNLMSRKMEEMRAVMIDVMREMTRVGTWDI